MKCAKCNNPITDEDIHYGDVMFRVVGWERDRKDGGTNHLAQRERTGGTAHRRCVVYKADPRQESLI